MGVFFLSLAIMVIQIIRHRAEFLYPTTLVIRTFILGALTVFYMVYGDPMFAVLIAIVGIGFLLTPTCYVLDRKRVISAGHERENSIPLPE